jgi:RNA polymerase sigma factor (sigma-70 family)
MKHEIDAYFEPDISWLGEINRQVLRLEREAEVFPPQRTRLDCSLWRGVENRAGVTLTLRVGEEEMRSRAEDASPVKATRRAFDELRRQLAAHTAKLREEGVWSRTSLNRGAREDGRGDGPETKREAAQAIERHLSGLYNFARREIAYRQAVGDLASGDLAPEEVVDEVALSTIERFGEHPPELEFDRWLLQLALEVIERRAGEVREERESLLHVEEQAPETPPAEEAADGGDEIFEFYQPDERVRLEDLIEDGRVPTPEEALARRELQQHINRSLARLPRRWREAFVLYAVEGLTLEEVARVVRRPVDETRREIESARGFLRECVAEAVATRVTSETRREEVNAL